MGRTYPLQCLSIRHRQSHSQKHLREITVLLKRHSGDVDWGDFKVFRTVGFRDRMSAPAQMVALMSICCLLSTVQRQKKSPRGAQWTSLSCQCVDCFRLFPLCNNCTILLQASSEKSPFHTLIEKKADFSQASSIVYVDLHNVCQWQLCVLIAFDAQCMTQLK